MTAPLRTIPELFALFQSADPDLKKLVWLLAKCSRTSCDLDGDIEIHEDDLEHYDSTKHMLFVAYDAGERDLCGSRIIFRADQE